MSQKYSEICSLLGRATWKPGQSEYKHSKLRSGDYHSEGASFNIPVIAYFTLSFHFISFLLFLNGGVLEGPQSRSRVSKKGLRFPPTVGLPQKEFL